MYLLPTYLPMCTCIHTCMRAHSHTLTHAHTHTQGNEGVSEVVSAMDAYDLVRDDWDSILELGQLKGRPDVASQIPSKVTFIIKTKDVT